MQISHGILSLWIPLVYAAGGEEKNEKSTGSCSRDDSFLGVGNASCIRENVGAATFLLTVIVLLSLILEGMVSKIRSSIKCPQLRTITNRLFEEIMILGFITTILFALNTAGVTDKVFDFEKQLTATEERHFKEFFHYVVFISMVYYILIVLALLAIGTYIPQQIWKQIPPEDAIQPMLPRVLTGEVPSVSIAYQRLRDKFEAESWKARFNIVKKFKLWKSTEILAFHVCRDRARAVYSSSFEMQRIFKLTEKQSQDMTYRRYNTLCMRNMVANITSIHWSAFIVLVGVVLVTSSWPEHDELIFLAIGFSLLTLSLVILVKVTRILRGIVKDRLRILTKRELDIVLAERSPRSVRPKKIKFKVVAQCVRAIIRMQMSALCHRGLHYHDDRFWFRSPWFLLRLFQFSTFGQAFYLVWFSLVQSLTILESDYGEIKLAFTLFIPIISIFVIIPLTMPSLVLILSLTGFFVEQGKLPVQRVDANKDHIRRVRRSYLRHSRRDSMSGTRTPRRSLRHSRASRTSRSSFGGDRRMSLSPTGSDVFLRQFDSPSSSFNSEGLLNSPTFSEDAADFSGFKTPKRESVAHEGTDEFSVDYENYGMKRTSALHSDAKIDIGDADQV